MENRSTPHNINVDILTGLFDASLSQQDPLDNLLDILGPNPRATSEAAESRDPYDEFLENIELLGVLPEPSEFAPFQHVDTQDSMTDDWDYKKPPVSLVSALETTTYTEATDPEEPRSVGYIRVQSELLDRIVSAFH